MNKHEIVVLALVIMLCLILGFMAGSYATMKAVADVASRFMDPELVDKALTQYYDNIKSCYPMNNASIYSNQGNKT